MRARGGLLKPNEGSLVMESPMTDSHMRSPIGRDAGRKAYYLL